jgi:hypothetical protein
MKKLIITLLIGISVNGFSQSPLAQLDSNLIGNFSFKTIPSYQKTGYSDTVTINISKEIIYDLKLDELAIFKLSLIANRKALGTLKEQSSYRVGKKFNLWTVKNEIKLSWEYFGANSYGAEKMNTIIITFDKKGEFKSSIVL